MTQLDFSKMDLSQFIAQIQATAKQSINTLPGSGRAITNVTSKITNYFGNSSATQGGMYLPSGSSGNLSPTATGNAPQLRSLPTVVPAN